MKKKNRYNLVLFLCSFVVTCCLSLHALQAEELQTMKYEAFDWDDNVVKMPSEIVLFPKVKTLQQKRSLSTSDFAKLKDLIGKEGELRDYQLGPDSYYRMADDPGGKVNFFLQDLEEALAKGTHWQGPVWRHFKQALDDPQMKDRVFIVTARGNSRKSIHEGIKRLQELGYIKYVMPEENIWVVGNDETFAGEFKAYFGKAPSEELLVRGADRSQAKLEVLKELLLQAQQGAEASGCLLDFHFSDDDRSNINRVLQGLSESVGKILSVHYTGG
ncbi:MAG: hypothetical protein HQK50_03345 [Oligoflexia bacterium]|nr:hypothetical protein [Oligoflexia bacterium]MBF0364578.1 hypothetical protein [Oligoflexia bacterium]